MITALRIGNFKAFAEPQTVPIKPLTLIFGANSAGKSSILHGLLLAHEADRTGNLNVLRTELGGDSVDLGGFRQYAHRHQFWQPVHWGVEIQVAALSGRLAELLAPARTVTIQLLIGVRESPWETAPAVETLAYELVVDGVSVLRASRRKISAGIEGLGQLTEDLRVDRIDHRHAVIETVLRAILETSTTATAFTPSDLESVTQAVDTLVPKLSVTAKGLLPLGVSVETTSPGEERRTLFPVGKGTRQEDLAAAIRFVLPRTLSELIAGLSEVVRSELGRLRYLGPLRSYPPRHLASDQYHDPNWLAGGGHAYEVLRTNESVRLAVNRWLSDREKLSTPYEVRVEQLVTVDDLELAYVRRVEGERETLVQELEVREEEAEDLSEWKEEVSFDHLRELEHAEARLQVLHLVDKRTDTQLTHRDVGIGVSQVLPVLVTAYGSSNRIVAIEQPEIHLHPALQAELADVFIDSALGERKNTFILETHSEHLILRVLRRIRETATRELPKDATPIAPDQVSVLYVQPGARGSEVIHIPVNADGEFERPWPEGFFAERVRELF